MVWQCEVWANKMDKAAFKKKYGQYLSSVVYEPNLMNFLIETAYPTALEHLFNADDDIFAFGEFEAARAEQLSLWSA